MDEKTFFDYLDQKFELLTKRVNEVEDLLSNKLDDVLHIKTAVQKTLGDVSKEPKTTNTYNKFIIHHEGEDYEYTKNKTCKYCGEHWTAWKKPYVKGDKPIAVAFDGKILPGCPKYA